MLLCNETVTLVHHTPGANSDAYACTAIVGVSWYGKRGDAPSASDGEAPREAYTVRIPAAVVPEVLPQAGDLLVRGMFAEYTGRKSLKGREWFRISSVGDHRRGKFLQHVVVKNT